MPRKKSHNNTWSPAARAKRAATMAARKVEREAARGTEVQVYREGERPNLALASELKTTRRPGADDMKDRQDIVKGMLAYLLHGVKR